MRTVLKTAIALVLTLLIWAPAARAAPYEYAFVNYRANLEKEVNGVAAKGWELFDVGFTPSGGYLACYRRPPGRTTPAGTYAFDVCGSQNAEEKTNNASKNGWRLVKLCTTANHVYALCCVKISTPGPHYTFEHHLAKDLTNIVNDHAKKGLELVDIAFGGDGYLLCFQPVRPNPKAPEYLIGDSKTAGLQQTFEGLTKNGWDLLHLIECTDSLTCLCLRKTDHAHQYQFVRVAGRNIESTADEAVKNGWEVHRVMADPGMFMDFAETADMIRQSLPYTLVLRR